MNDIVRLTTYLTDMNDVAAYLGGVRAGVFQGELPAASTVAVSAIGRQGALIEIDAIAHLAPPAATSPPASPRFRRNSKRTESDPRWAARRCERIAMKMRVVRSGLEFPEGPIVMPDGSVVLVEMRGERLTRIQPDGRAETIAQLPRGGPNGAALGPDGMIYVCNNGGMSFTPPHGTGWVPGPVDPTSYTGGRIERVDPETGRVELLHNHCGDVALRHPNDLVFDAAGGFWFTDTGKRMGRVFDLGGRLLRPARWGGW